MAPDRFDAAMLDRLTAALTEHVGPDACIVVAKAAEKALDVYQLCMSVAAHVPAADRVRFLDGVADVMRMGGATWNTAAPAATEAPHPGAARAPNAAALGPETLAQAAKRLAQYLGPLAQVLVDKESRNVKNPADLYARLATHIRDPDARKAFIADMPR